MSADGKVGFAVIGLGNIAQSSVLPAFANCKRAKLVAVVSRDKEKAERLAQKFNAKFHYQNGGFAACLANREVDAVYVATPNGTHEEFALQAAAAKKHVLSEKPLAATALQAEQMVKACERNGVLLMTAYRKYYEPSSVELKRLVRSGELGEIDMIQTSFSELYRPGISPAWLIDETLAGGGPLMDLGVYCVSTSRWLLGELPDRVTAIAWRHDRGTFRHVEEGIAFALHFPGGAKVQATSTYSVLMSSFVFVQGKKGSAMLSPAFPFEYERTLIVQTSGDPVTLKFPVVDEFALEIEEFARAVQEKRGVEASGMEGYRDMIIIDGIYDAARRQGTVELKY
jgi:predicted dehydrogenase